MTPYSPGGASHRRRRWPDGRSVLWPALLAVLLAACMVAYGASHFVRYRVMDDRFYLEALEEQRVYDRLYQQILADPALAEAVDPLLGDIGASRPFLVSILRLVLPPEVIRGHVEDAGRQWERFIRGESDYWAPQVDLRGVDEGIVSFVNAYIASRVAVTPEQEVDSTPEFMREADDGLDRVARGEVPDTIPALRATNPAQADAIAALVLAGAPATTTPEMQQQIAAALLAGDAAEALALAVPAYLTPQLRDSAQRWRERIGDDHELDLVPAFEEISGQERGQTAQALLDVRAVVRFAGVYMGIASVVLGLLALLALLAVVLVQGRSPLRWLGATSLGAAALGAVALVVAVRVYESETSSRIENLPASFPPSIAMVLDDVASQLAFEFTSASVPVVVSIALLGAILLVGRWTLERAHASLALLRRPRWRIALVAGTGLAAVLLLAAAEFGAARSGNQLMLCNGQFHLCDRRLDEVVFAGTHNSMAAADLGWIFPHHDSGIRAQLDAGFRALLLDTHYWKSEHAFIPFRDQLSEEHERALRALLMEVDPPRPGTYLCHSACGLGATPLETALISIEGFLRARPNEVVMLFIEDYVTPEDTREAFEASGLLQLVYHPEEDEDDWPTLRELIERGQRVVVFADHQGGAYDWYLPFGDYVQDTPWRFSTASQFSCERNRGDPDASMFMVNHWITTHPPDRANAVLVNRRQVLLDRVEACAEAREMRPNVIVVDFFAIGHTLRVVDELNRRPL